MTVFSTTLGFAIDPETVVTSVGLGLDKILLVRSPRTRTTEMLKIRHTLVRVRNALFLM